MTTWHETRSAQWAIIIAAVFLLHALLLLIARDWSWRTPPAKIEVLPISSEQLSQIKKNWKQKKLLISKDQKNITATPPKEARYRSDQNRTVEKETRARKTDILTRRRKKTQQNGKKKEQSKTRLSDLGVPIPAPSLEEKKQLSQDGDDAVDSDQSLANEAAELGEKNILNTERSIYHSFYSRIYEAIGPIWSSYAREIPYKQAVPQGSYATQVEIHLNSAGELIQITLLKGSGIAEFDQAVDRAWRKIQRFPNPPQDLVKNKAVKMTWEFRFDMTGSGPIRYGAPRRLRR